MFDSIFDDEEKSAWVTEWKTAKDSIPKTIIKIYNKLWEFREAN